MIEDLDGADRSPSRARAWRAVSIALMLGAAIAYGAVSTQVLRAPRSAYATPDPNTAALDLVNGTRYTPMPRVNVDPAALTSRVVQGCVVPPSLATVTVFVGDRSVVIERPLPTSASSWCAIPRLDLPRLPSDSFAP